MGYDMYIEGAIGDKAYLKHDWRRQMRLNRSRGYREAAMREILTGETKVRDEPEYFRLNIWGMGYCREIMEHFEMGYWINPPPFPEAENYGTTWELVEALADGASMSDEQATAARACKDAQEAHLSYVEPGQVGIALHKTCSNDGWLITPTECREAVQAWCRNADGDWLVEDPMRKFPNRLTLKIEDPVPLRTIEWWLPWIEYLALAADHDGFRVH